MQRLNGEARALMNMVAKLAYFMRGGATYGEIMLMTAGERDNIATLIEERLEAEKKNPYPVY